MEAERSTFLGLAPGHKKEKKRNKPNFSQPIFNQWVTASFQYGGVARLSDVSPIASPGDGGTPG